MIFEEGKEELGFDHYETRSWLGWQHHMLLVFLAHHFLVRLRVTFKDQASALSIYQVRLLLSSVLPKPAFDAPAALRRVLYYQKRNYAAYLSHGTLTLIRGDVDVLAFERIPNIDRLEPYAAEETGDFCPFLLP